MVFPSNQYLVGHAESIHYDRFTNFTRPATSMRVKILLFLFLILPKVPLVYAACSCTSLNHDRTKSHIQLSLNTAPDLKFYDNNKLQGEASIKLNEKGAYTEGEPVCSWPNGAFMKGILPNRVLGFDGQEINHPCPAGFPIESGFGDLGVGTAVLCLELSLQSGDLIEVTYKGKTHFLDLKTLIDTNFNTEPGTNEPCGQPQ